MKQTLVAVAVMTAMFCGGAFAQTAQWVKQMGTGGISNGVSSDAAGNAYATGTVSSPALFDNISIPCNVSDVFLTKYDSSGNILWANVGGGPLLDQANDIATDASGNSYVVGAIQTNGIYPTAQFGSFTLTGHGDVDWLVVKYDTLGNVVWAKNYGSTAGDIAEGVTLDPAGNLYVTGLFSSTMTVEGVTVTSKGLFDVFLAKFDPNGTLLWLKTAGGTGADIAHGVVSDSLGNVGIVGEFQNTATFGSHSVRAAGLGDAFIAKYDSAGNNLWVHNGGGTISFEIDAARAGFRAATGRQLEPLSDPESILIQRELGQYAVRLLWTLSPRERRLLACHYGLLDQPPLSPVRSAAIEGVSRGRIFQVLQKAHRKLQARCQAAFSRSPAGAAARAASPRLFVRRSSRCR